MITNKLMWSAIFTSFSHPCVMSGVLADVIWGVVVNMLSDVMTVAIIDVVSATDVDILTDENVNDLAAVMTPLEFTLSGP